MGGEAIREFLVKLAYAVDEHSKNRFVESIAHSTANVLKFAAAVQATAVGVVAATAKMAAGLEAVYFASRRTGSEAEKLIALGHAAKQAGVSVEGMSGSVEGLARFLRMNPGGEGFLQNLGVQTRDAKGQLRDMTELLFAFVEKTRNMPLHQAAAYGSIFDLDEAKLSALRSGEIQKHFEEYRRMVRQTGVDIEGATKNSNAFMTTLRNVGAVFDVIRIAATDALQRSIGPQLEGFRRWLVSHSKEIAALIGGIGLGFVELAKIIGSTAKAAFDMGRDAVAAYQSMDDGSKTALKAVGLLLAGWLALNAGILASPVGAVAALAAALVGLYEDYKTWLEGGQSVINWGVWSKELADAKAGLAELRDAISELFGPAATSAAEAAGAKFKGVWASAFSDPIGNTVREIKNLIVWYGHLAHLMAAIARGDLAGATKAAGDMARHLMGTDGSAPGNPQILNGPDSPGDAARPSLLRRFQGWLPEVLGGGGGWAGGGAGGASSGAGGASLPPGAPVPQHQVSSASESFQFWKSKGFTDAGAAGMVANEKQESEFNPNARGDNGHAHGLYQWQAPRRKDLLLKTGIDVSTATAAQQREAMWLEMSRGIDKQSGWAFERIKNATSAAEAGALVSQYVERPKKVEEEKRMRAASAEAIQRQFAGARPAGAADTNAPVGWRVPGGVPASARRFQASPAGVPGAGQGAGGTTIAPVLNQKTEINVQGRADAQAVAAAQNRVNQEGIRNLTGAFR